MTPIILAEAMRIKTARATIWAPFITAAMDEFEIDTPKRQAMFLAQIGHESGGLAYVKEIWGPTPAQLKYDTRADLGNYLVGDGYRYLGRGPIQLTGRDNYQRLSDALGVDFITDPEKLEEPVNGARAAGWFWQTNRLNRFADRDSLDGCSDVINLGRVTPAVGDSNGYADRATRWEWAKKVLC